MNKDQKEILESEVSNAAHSQQVLNNPAYREAFIARKAKIFDNFCKSKPEEVGKRETAYLEMRNLLSLERYFEKSLQSGKMAEQTLDMNEEK